ncbi:MAG: (Fe-S)-binding protein [bacterium]|nr:(Fe-S)-binding protein [bacterium]
MQKLLKELVENTKCNRCGWCLYVCPTYLSTKDENFSPRGRIELLKAAFNGKVRIEDYRYELNTCITCSRCTDVCYSNADVAKLIKYFRKKNTLLDDLAYIYFKYLFGISIRFLTKINLILKNRIIPSDYYNEKCSININTIFQSCPDVFLDTNLKKYAFKIFGSRIGFNKFTCCGLVPYTLGFINTAKRLAKKNIEFWLKNNKPVYFVIDTSCYNHLKSYPELINTPQAKEFSSSIVNIVDYIMQNRNALELDSYYLQVSCKTLDKERFSSYFRGLKSFECCGGGGINFLLKQKPAIKQIKRKVKDIGNRVVITNSASCMHSMKALGVKSKHVFEFIYEKLYKIY